MSRAFASLNLRCNPFGELTPEDVAATALIDWAPLREALQAGLSIQLVGRCGRGKSTHLRAIEATWPGAVYRRVWSREFTGERPKTPDVPSGTQVLLLDEADQLQPFARIAVMRRAAQVVVATHHDLTLSLRLAGHRSVRVDVARPATVEWLESALRKRIEYFRRTEGPVPTVDEPSLSALVARFGDDLRALERHLYEDFQTRSR